ncbi:cadherin-like protein 26 [Poecilia latipinna]|uniref:cadherin-like protein 26 n=1 Tax=Poecilia latipinna TaxID=48699 RepID=UPI00072DCA66|nr:PREDICTED: cadherin-like protein 26 [Poecilia latipinna]
MYFVSQLIFQAFKKEKGDINAKIGINIDIIDTNDNEPKFNNHVYEVTIEEAPSQGTELVNVTATDRDSTEKNRKFSFSIESVSPTPQNFEFVINEEPDSGNGTISFKGCLDHEKAQKYTLIVKATDHGQPKSLSSSTTVIINIEDGNRHLPVFTKQKGEASVKEGLQGVLISRLQVTDEDTRGTKAWKAKYKIQGDTNGNFRIDTDPETNEGLVYVQKILDYEEDPLKNIIISAENEILYFTCKVINRNTAGLWEIKTVNGSTFSEAQGVTGTKEMRLSTYHLTVNIEDVNEPPVFDPSNKTITAYEDVALGYYLETLIAKDPDVNGANQIRYMIGEDPAGFVTVDSNSGKITTSKSLDRESQLVKDGLYVIKIYATDNGEPSQTGTATLSIKIVDVNDNAPSLDKSIIDMCQTDKISLVSVTALDPDAEPYSGPFSFKLLGDVKDKWRIDPEKGHSFKLVNEHKATIMIFGQHELQLEVSDRQGKTAVHSLSVSVCKCSKTPKPDCRLKKHTGSRLGPGALGILFLSILLFIGFLLLTFLMSCKPERIPFPNDSAGQYLMISNSEGPGSDCKLPLGNLGHIGHGQQMQISQGKPLTVMPVLVDDNSQMSQNTISCQQETILEINSALPTIDGQWMIPHGSSTSGMKKRHQQQEIKKANQTVGILQSQHVLEDLQYNLIKTKVLTLEESGKELGDYEPVIYADEGDFEHNFELDALSDPGVSFDQDMELDYTFLPLASICSPDIAAYFGKEQSLIQQDIFIS